MTDIIASDIKIQIESVQTTAPVSESSLTAIGGATNYCLANVTPVGTVLSSFLDQPTFQAQTSTAWVLCDGRSVVGSQFQSLTGLTNIPDMRALYPRMKDNGAELDPHGDLPLGSTYTDEFKAHTHSTTASGDSIRTDFFNGDTNVDSGTPFPIYNTKVLGPLIPFNVTGTLETVGGIETNPKTMIVNYFVRIN